MNERKIIVGMDLGSYRISVIVAEVDERGSSRVLGLGTVPSEGIRKGLVVGFEPALDSVHRAIEEAERASGMSIQSVFAGVTGDHFRALRSEGVHAKEGGKREISGEDVEQVIRVARSLQLPAGYRIQHTLPIDYILDNRAGIRDPVGMDGSRLQAEVLLLLGEIAVLDNATKLIEKAGLGVEALVFGPLATGLAALQEAEREEGVVLLDIGGGCTDVLVIRGGAARHAEVLPLGGGNVTRDLSIGLNISFEDAERLKLDHASLLPAADDQARIPIRQVGREEERFVTVATLRSIVEPRVQEILELAWEKARASESGRRAATGVVICGGGAMLPGLPSLAGQIYERGVRLAAPLVSEGLTAELQDPRYTPLVGLLQYGFRRLGRRAGAQEANAGLATNFRGWLRALGRRAGK